MWATVVVGMLLLAWLVHGLVTYLWVKRHEGVSIPWLQWADMRPVLWATEVDMERVVKGESQGVRVAISYDRQTILVVRPGWRAWVMKCYYRGIERFWWAMCATATGFRLFARTGRAKSRVK